MKRFFTLLSALLAAAAALAQTPEEIVTRMEEAMSKHEKEGIVMTVDVKVPVVGTMTTTTWTLGDKMRLETETMGIKAISWSDGKTDWTYVSKKNEVTIEKTKGPSSDAGDVEMFTGITDDYDVTLSKETDKAWYLTCKKSKTNKDKDAPKNIDLVVSKANYYPVSLSTKVSGISLTMRGVSFGVTDKQVTFNAADFPGVTVVDKR